MPYNTEDEWRALFKRVSNRNFQIQKRIDALQRDKFVGTPVGLDLEDSETVTRSLTAPEKNALRSAIAALANANSADYLAAIAP